MSSKLDIPTQRCPLLHHSELLLSTPVVRTRLHPETWSNTGSPEMHPNRSTDACDWLYNHLCTATANPPSLTQHMIAWSYFCDLDWHHLWFDPWALCPIRWVLWCLSETGLWSQVISWQELYTAQSPDALSKTSRILFSLWSWAVLRVMTLLFAYRE